MSISYSHGGCAVPLRGETIGDAFDQAAASRPEGLALVCRETGTRLPWSGLRERVDALAAGLLTLGIGRSDRLGIWAMNQAEWVIVQFAAARIGAILVSINPAYRIPELSHALDVCDCAALVIGPTFKDSDYAGMLQAVLPEVGDTLPGKRWPALRTVIQIGEATLGGARSLADVEALGSTADPARLQEVAALVQIDDPACIKFTSGTTGLPKGVVQTHHTLVNNGFFTGRAMGLQPGEALCLPVPLQHMFGMSVGAMTCLMHRVTIVLPGRHFDPVATLQAISDERCVALYGVPTMYIAMLTSPIFEQTDLTSLRTGIMAGALCPEELMRDVMTRMNMREITICYGMTECPNVTQSALDLPISLRTTTVGTVHPHVEFKLTGEGGQIVPRGEPGEVCTRGYHTMLGYWRNPQATAEVVDAAGWLHTGDIGTVDEAGNLRIVGRIKDLVIRGGENLYPKEIEEVLFGHDGIRDVQVFGVPDDKYGEELCAWIVPSSADLTEQSVRNYCASRMTRQKTPRYIRFVDAFPMNVMGKVQKRVLRSMMCEQLGIAQG